METKRDGEVSGASQSRRRHERHALPISHSAEQSSDLAALGKYRTSTWRKKEIGERGLGAREDQREGRKGDVRQVA